MGHQGHSKTSNKTAVRTTLAFCATALSLLAFATPAQATKAHTFDPVLSLRGNCSVSALDEVADPGRCPIPPGVPGVDHPLKAFDAPCSTAVDRHGDIYISSFSTGTNTGRIDVFNAKGEYLTTIKYDRRPCKIAVDSQGNVYANEWEITANLVLFKAKSFPPAKGSAYEGPTILRKGDLLGTCDTVSRSLAIDPSDDHLFVATGLGCDEIFEYGSAAEGNPLLAEHDSEGAAWQFRDIAVYGKNHDIYATGWSSEAPSSGTGGAEYSRAFIFDGSDGHLKCETHGSEAPQGGFGESDAGVAVDQANGDLYFDDVTAHGVVDQFDSSCHYIGQLEHSFTTPNNLLGAGLAVDDPYPGQAGYDSPNKGELYVASGSNPSKYHLWAFAGVGEPELEEFPLTVSITGTGTGKVTSTPAGIDCDPTCSAEYEEGTQVTLEAKAGAGSTFAGWSGACSGSASCKVTMTEAKSVGAEFEEEESSGPVFHKLTAAVTGNGEVSADTGTITGCTSAGGPTCEGEYEQGSQVALTETPGEGSLFGGWQTLQCDESTASTCEVTIGSGDEGVAASFIAAQPLKVSTEGPGTVTSSPGLISCTPFCEDSFAKETKVTLSATPAPGSLFIAWKHCDSGGVLGAHCTVAMDKAKAVTAVFASGHALIVAKADGSGPGKVQSSPAAIYCLYNCQSAAAAFGATIKVTLKETPAKHFHFAGFSGDCEGTGPCEVTMGQDREVKALFAPNTKYSLTLAKTGGGKGIVRSYPAGINCAYACTSTTASYDEGEEVELEVSKVALGSTFGGWSGGGCSGTATTCTVAMTEAKEVKTEFR